MIIIRPMGGLGNQMFQYAFGLFTAINNNTTLKIDTSLLVFSKDKSKTPHRSLELDIFNIDIEYTTLFEIELYNGNPDSNFFNRAYTRLLRKIYNAKLYVQKDHEFNENQLRIPNNTCIVGRWQSELYFKPIEETIRKQFSFKKPIASNYHFFLDKINKSKNPVSIHIRRTDYINHPVFSKAIGGLSDTYYIQAIKTLEKNLPSPNFFVFSDEIEYTKKLIKQAGIVNEITYIHVEYPNSHDELQLMTKCKHHIISNSTFSWWGTWLSNKQIDSITVAPKNWAITKEYTPRFIHCKNWILL